MARNKFFREMATVDEHEITKRIDAAQDQKSINQQLTDCINKLTNSYNLCEKSVYEHQRDLTDHEKRLVTLEQWAEKCSKATAAHRAETKPESKVETPDDSSAKQPTKSTPQPQEATPDKGAKVPASEGYPVEDGPRVMYKYHQRVRNDAGKVFDVWSGPKLTRAEAEAAGSGLTQEILAWIKNGKIVLVEPIASRENL